MCLQFYSKWCQGIAEMHFFIPHLFNSSLPSQTSPLFLQDPRVLVPVVITEIFPVPAAYQSWWQLYNLGGIRYVVLTSAGLSWRFQHSMLSNWCNPPCFVWEVCLFVRFFMISMKETCIFQALLGKRWWLVRGCHTSFRNSASALGSIRAPAHRRLFCSCNKPKLVPDRFKKMQPFRGNTDLSTKTKTLKKSAPSCLLLDIYHLGIMWQAYPTWGKLAHAVFWARLTCVSQPHWEHRGCSFWPVPFSVKPISKTPSIFSTCSHGLHPPSPCQAPWFPVASSCCGRGKRLAPAQGQYGGLGTSPQPPWIENGKQRAITCHTWQWVQTEESFSPPEQDSSMLFNCYHIQTSKPTIPFVTDACFCRGKCTFRAGWESLLSTGQQHWKLFSPLTYFLKVPLFNFNTQLQFFHITLDKSCKLPPYWHHITSNQLINHKGLAFSYHFITGEMGFQKACTSLACT